jgi:hypothetical protein
MALAVENIQYLFCLALMPALLVIMRQALQPVEVASDLRVEQFVLADFRAGIFCRHTDLYQGLLDSL